MSGITTSETRSASLWEQARAAEEQARTLRDQAFNAEREEQAEQDAATIAAVAEHLGVNVDTFRAFLVRVSGVSYTPVDRLVSYLGRALPSGE